MPVRVSRGAAYSIDSAAEGWLADPWLGSDPLRGSDPLGSSALPQMQKPLDFALIRRLREVLDDRPATESELRTLGEQADAWARTVGGQIESSERRIKRLEQNPASSLAQIASELRRVEQLRPQLHEVRQLQGDLEARARQVRTEWLLSQATSRRPAGRRP